MNMDKVNSAIDEAKDKFNEWNDTTGFVEPNTGYYFELESLIVDAFFCGINCALHNKEPSFVALEHHNSLNFLNDWVAEKFKND